MTVCLFSELYPGVPSGNSRWVGSYITTTKYNSYNVTQLQGFMKSNTLLII